LSDTFQIDLPRREHRLSCATIVMPWSENSILNKTVNSLRIHFCDCYHWLHYSQNGT